MKRISDKKLASLGGKLPFSTISSAPKRIRKKPRSKQDFERIYGSKARVAWIRSLSCAACGCSYVPSENAHIECGGTGYKADFDKIIPLCRHRINTEGGSLGYPPIAGCHAELHKIGRESFEKRWGINLEELASATQSRWLEAHPKKETK